MISGHIHCSEKKGFSMVLKDDRPKEGKITGCIQRRILSGPLFRKANQKLILYDNLSMNPHVCMNVAVKTGISPNVARDDEVIKTTHFDVWMKPNVF